MESGSSTSSGARLCHALGKCGAARAIDTGSTPAWIYVVGAVALGLALLVVILHLTGTIQPTTSAPLWRDAPLCATGPCAYSLYLRGRK